MPPESLFHGLLVPVLTPFHRDLTPHAERFVAFCRWLLSEGVHGLAVFGTNSEANSMSVVERQTLLEDLVDSGIPPEVLMPGTGACAVPDAVELTGHAVQLCAGGVLVLPPFYYKNQTDDGFFAYYSELIDRVGDSRLKIYLYHFPQISAAPISPALIARLRKRYPETVVGVKDSSGDWESTKQLIAEFPDMAVFPSSEARLNEALSLGMAGCISGTGNVQPRAIRCLIDAHGTPEAENWHHRVSAVRSLFEQYPLIPALKAVVARDSGEDDWAITRPPLVPLSRETASQLFEALDATGCYDPVRVAAPAMS